MPDEVREHLTRDQRPFIHTESLQTPYIPSSMLVLLLFSSPHKLSLGFRSEDWNGHSRSLVLCSVTHFVLFLRFMFGLLYGWKIKTWSIIRFLTDTLIFYLLVFDRIHDAICLNKMSRTSSRNIGPQHHCTDWGTFIPVFTKPILSVCC